MKSSKIFLTSVLLLLTLVLTAQAAWTSAPANPPENNAPQPLNVTPTSQTKDGLLMLKALISPWIAVGDAIFSGKFQIANGSEGTGKVLSSVDQYGNAQWVATSSLGLNGSSSYWSLLPSGNLGNTNTNKNVEISGKLVTKNIEAPACIPGSGLLGGLACMFGDVVNIGNGQISGDGKASLVVDNFVIGKNIAATSWLVAGEKFQYATSTAGEGKVLISTSTDGIADWADFSTLYQNCIDSNACPNITGDNNWEVNSVGQLVNKNANGNVGIVANLGIGGRFSVNNTSILGGGAEIIGSNALEFGTVLPGTKATDAGKIRYNNTAPRSLNIYGGGVVGTRRLVNIYDDLNVNGTTTANVFCTTDGSCTDSLVLNKSNLFHSADVNKDWKINATERAYVQTLYNAGSYHCDANANSGYAAGPGSHLCNHHSADPNGDWVIDLSELNRVIQFYNIASGYDVCLFSEDGFKPNGAGYPCSSDMYAASSSIPDGSSFGETLYWDTTAWKASKNLINDESRFSVAVNNLIMPGQAMFTYNYDTTGQVGTIRALGTGLDITGVDQGSFRKVNINDVLTVSNKIFTPNLEITNGTFALKGNGAGAGKVLISDVAGNATWVATSTLGVGNGLATGPVSATLRSNGTSWLADSTTLTNNGTNVAVGAAPDAAAKLLVQGKLKVVDGTQANGYILQSDNTGLAKWVATSTLGISGATETNWTRIGANLSPKNIGDKVGVGTNAPASLLTVFKNASGGRGGEISIVNGAGAAAGNEAALNFGTNSSTYDGNAGDIQLLARTTNTNGATDLIFSSWDGTSFGERMRLVSNGLVGIGTNAPTAKLDVAGRIHSTGLISSDNGLSTSGTTTSVGLNVSDYAFINKLSAPTATINSLTSVVANVDRLVVSPPSNLPQPQAGYVLTAQGTNGIAEWRPPVSGGTTLPSGTTGQTLSWNGSWLPNSAILNTGSLVTISKPTIHTDNLQVNSTGAFLALGNAAVMGNLGVGVSAQSKLDVNGQITIRGGSPVAGKVLTAVDGSGLATWQTPVVGASYTAPAAGGLLLTGSAFSIADNGVTSTRIADGAVNLADIASNAVNSLKVVDNSLTGSDILDLSINTADLADDSITGAKISPMGATANQILRWNSTTGVWAPSNETPSGLPTATSGNANQVLRSNGTTGWVAGGSGLILDPLPTGKVGINSPGLATLQSQTERLQVSGGLLTDNLRVKNNGTVVDGRVLTSASGNGTAVWDDVKIASIYCEWTKNSSGNFVANGGCTGSIASSNANDNYILTCPATYKVVSGGAWCDSSFGSMNALRESRPNSINSWKISCRQTNSLFGSVSSQPSGASLVCAK